MSDQAPPPQDLFVTQFQFTPTAPRDIYPAIHPSLPQHSQADKTVIITGASQGIGRAIAQAFATAGAKNLVLFARNAAKLSETAALIPKTTHVVTVAGDVTSVEGVKRLEETVREKFGTADACVNCAGQWLSRGPIQTEPVEGWWRDMEVNIKGTYLVTAAFLRLVAKEPKVRPVVVNVSTFGCNIVVPHCSSYSLSKSTMNRFTEYVAAENPHVTAICYNPGSVATAILDVHPDFAHFALDTHELAGATAVYCASPRAEYLNGRYMSCNWNVEELEKRKDEILSKDLLKMGLRGEFGADLFKL